MEPTLFIIGLILLGWVCFALEIITPSFGILAVGGLVSMVWAIAEGFAQSALVGWLLIPALLVGTLAYMSVMIKILPDSKLAGKIFLGASKHDQGEAAPQSEVHRGLVGKSGTAETPLRPSGTVRIDGQRYDASAEAGMIARGTAVKVLRARGSGLVVAPVAESAGTVPAPEETGNASSDATSDQT
jgi:membrane-bound serine protease (ClpP class)